MNKILFDETLRAKLGDLRQPVQLCDESGAVVAEIWPADISFYEPLTPGVSDEELQRRLDSDEPRYTTAEVLRYLESL